MIELRLCERCKSSTEIHEHHIIPKCIGGKDIDGRIILCKKCHDILHNLYNKWLYDYVSSIKRLECKKNLKDKVNWFIRTKW